MNKTVGLVVGVFDLFHPGHVRLLKNARESVDHLVAIINSDSVTSQYKRPPVMNERNRKEVVDACRYVDESEIADAFDVKPFIEKHCVTHIFHGDDWERASYLRQVRVTEEYLRTKGVSMVFLPYTKFISTSDLLLACAQVVRQAEGPR